MQIFNITIFEIEAVSLDARALNVFYFMQFERECTPISTLVHSGFTYFFFSGEGNKVTVPPPAPTPSHKSEGAQNVICSARRSHLLPLC